MRLPARQPALTRDDCHLIALLRQGPQSVAGLAAARQASVGAIEDALAALHGKVGLVRLFRYDTLRYGLAE